MQLLHTSLTLLTLATPALADTITIEPDKDNTLYESDEGTLSNGSGERLFAGATSVGFLRRTLLHFDLSGIPSGATVTSVTLDMQVSRVPFLPPSTQFDLHRLTQDWGEGASNALIEEGGGAPSEAGDATWLHTFFPGSLWTNEGGDFVAGFSATTLYSGGIGPISWSSAGLVADVQGWLDGASGNFGWLIKARNEGQPENAKRFDSRERAPAATRPRLTVEYATGPVTDVPALPAAGLAGMALLLLAAGGFVLARR